MSVVNCVTSVSRRVHSAISNVFDYVSQHRVVVASCAVGTAACAIYLQQGGDFSENLSDMGGAANSLMSSAASIIPTGVREKVGRLFGMRRRPMGFGGTSGGTRNGRGGRYHTESEGKLDLDSLSRTQRL